MLDRTVPRFGSVQVDHGFLFCTVFYIWEMKGLSFEVVEGFHGGSNISWKAKEILVLSEAWRVEKILDSKKMVDESRL